MQGPRLLAYDLDLLHDYVERKGVTKLVLALQDSEAFDPALLSDLLSLLRYDHFAMHCYNAHSSISALGSTVSLSPCYLASQQLSNCSKADFRDPASPCSGASISKSTTQATALTAYTSLCRLKTVNSGWDGMLRPFYLRGQTTISKAPRRSVGR